MVAGNETPVLLHDLPSALAENDVPTFLAQYGYKAAGVIQMACKMPGEERIGVVQLEAPT